MLLFFSFWFTKENLWNYIFSSALGEASRVSRFGANSLYDVVVVVVVVVAVVFNWCLCVSTANWADR